MNKTPVTMSTIRPSTMRKYRAIHARYQHLYNIERRRIDDVQQQLCEEFFLSQSRLMLILKLEL